MTAPMIPPLPERTDVYGAMMVPGAPMSLLYETQWQGCVVTILAGPGGMFYLRAREADGTARVARLEDPLLVRGLLGMIKAAHTLGLRQALNATIDQRQRAMIEEQLAMVSREDPPNLGSGPWDLYGH